MWDAFSARVFWGSDRKLAFVVSRDSWVSQDVWSLFMIIDADRSGLIDLEEFVVGCMTPGCESWRGQRH